MPVVTKDFFDSLMSCKPKIEKDVDKLWEYLQVSHKTQPVSKFLWKFRTGKPSMILHYYHLVTFNNQGHISVTQSMPFKSYQNLFELMTNLVWIRCYFYPTGLIQNEDVFFHQLASKNITSLFSKLCVQYEIPNDVECDPVFINQLASSMVCYSQYLFFALIDNAPFDFLHNIKRKETADSVPSVQPITS